MQAIKRTSLIQLRSLFGSYQELFVERNMYLKSLIETIMGFVLAIIPSRQETMGLFKVDTARTAIRRYEGSR